MIIGPNPASHIDMKSAVVPLQHVFNYRIVDFTLHFEHLEDLVLESRFKVHRIESGRRLKTAVCKETTVGHNSVKLGTSLLSEKVYF